MTSSGPIGGYRSVLSAAWLEYGGSGVVCVVVSGIGMVNCLDVDILEGGEWCGKFVVGSEDALTSITPRELWNCSVMCCHSLVLSVLLLEWCMWSLAAAKHWHSSSFGSCKLCNV